MVTPSTGDYYFFFNEAKLFVSLKGKNVILWVLKPNLLKMASN